MQVEERVHSYIDIPAHALVPEWRVAARKLLVRYFGGSTVLRSTDPAGYLMPDLDPAVVAPLGPGTVKPESVRCRHRHGRHRRFRLAATSEVSEPTDRWCKRATSSS